MKRAGVALAAAAFAWGGAAAHQNRESSVSCGDSTALILRTGFKISRNISLRFHHQLGLAEAKRRVTARLERLRVQFADKVGDSTITWTGDEASVQATAFAQDATGHVIVSDTDVRIDVRLPLLLAPLGGNIETFLTRTAEDTLHP